MVEISEHIDKAFDHWTTYLHV